MQTFLQSSDLSFHIKHKIFAKLFSTKIKNRKVFQVNFRFKNFTAQLRLWKSVALLVTVWGFAFGREIEAQKPILLLKFN